MRALLGLTLLVLFSFCAALLSNNAIDQLFNGKLRLTPNVKLSEEDNEILFRTFIKRYNKEHASNEIVFKHRLNVFVNNLNRVKKMNANQNMTTYGVTKFMDLEPEEFRSIYLNKPMPSEMRSIPRMDEVPEINDPLPQDWNWQHHGAVTPVKDQGQCGSCWAFSTTGNIEGQWFLAGHNLTSLSEQQLVDCDHECEPDAPKDCDAGCDGGLMDNAFRWIIKNNGIATERSYPYRAITGRCKVDPKIQIGAKISNFTMLPKNETQIQSYLYQHGPVSIAVNADPLQYYQSGILSGSCNPNDLNHGVLLVGYGYQKPWWIFKGFTWWIVKNSWSSSWGENGYYRMAFGQNECGVTEFALSSRV